MGCCKQQFRAIVFILISVDDCCFVLWCEAIKECTPFINVLILNQIIQFLLIEVVIWMLTHCIVDDDEGNG